MGTNNQGDFSAGFLDEEYLACALECTLRGTVDPGTLEREKVRCSLVHNAKLVVRLRECMNHDGEGNTIFHPEMDRVHRIVVKLARGHAAYELYPQLDEPDEVLCVPFGVMSDAQRRAFEDDPVEGPRNWPEVGSRAFMRACNIPPDPHDQIGQWIVIQPDRYRYSVNETGGVLVRMVLSEYLACEVFWDFAH